MLRARHYPIYEVKQSSFRVQIVHYQRLSLSQHSEVALIPTKVSSMVETASTPHTSTLFPRRTASHRAHPQPLHADRHRQRHRLHLTDIRPEHAAQVRPKRHQRRPPYRPVRVQDHIRSQGTSLQYNQLERARHPCWSATAEKLCGETMTLQNGLRILCAVHDRCLKSET